MAVEGDQEFSAQIGASPLQCFNTIVDFETYPKWNTAITHAAILEQDAKGIGRIVEFRIDLRIKTIRYVLEYEYRKPAELTWHAIDGDVDAIEGAYQFKKVGARHTVATCRQVITFSMWIPGPIRRIAERSALRESVLELKREVERRYPAKA